MIDVLMSDVSCIGLIDGFVLVCMCCISMDALNDDECGYVVVIVVIWLI
jgi:hypothetical protein